MGLTLLALATLLVLLLLAIGIWTLIGQPIQRNRAHTEQRSSSSSLPTVARTTVPARPEATAAPAEPVTAPRLQHLLPAEAIGFAVIDLETTGFGRSARIVEIAVVRLDPAGCVVEEWETIINPGIAIPNSHIHGIDDDDARSAPMFADIAGLLAAKLHRHVLVAHNLSSFDRPILEAHFAGIDGVQLSLGDGIDTMPNPRQKLAELCASHGVELNSSDAHSALGDTRALAQVLVKGIPHVQPAQQSVAVDKNTLLARPAQNYTRAMARREPAHSGWTAVRWTLEGNQTFATTGPASMRTDTEIKQAEQYASGLGLTYRKVSTLPKRNPPDFLISTNLKLRTRKMEDAMDRGLPVLLTRDIAAAALGSTVTAWRWSGNTSPQSTSSETS